MKKLLITFALIIAVQIVLLAAYQVNGGHVSWIKLFAIVVPCLLALTVCRMVMVNNKPREKLKEQLTGKNLSV